jgi:hypothetical protein
MYRRRQENGIRVRSQKWAVGWVLVRCYSDDGRLRGDMRKEGEELGGLARVGDEENRVILMAVSKRLKAQGMGQALQTFRMSPRSPCNASAACMKLHAIPKLFIVATVFLPTSPLLPTPHTISLPPASLALTMVSTLRRSPSCATESVSYRSVTCDSAVAAVERTLTARETRRVPSTSDAVSGGVSGCDSNSVRFRFWHVEVGGGVIVEVCSVVVILRVGSGSSERHSKAQGAPALYDPEAYSLMGSVGGEVPTSKVRGVIL